MPRKAAVAFALLAAALPGAWALPAGAEPLACGPREIVVDALQHNFAEAPAAVAVSSEGDLVEILASEAGTWTLLVSIPGGDSCVIAEGDGWKQFGAGDLDRLTGVRDGYRPAAAADGF